MGLHTGELERTATASSATPSTGRPGSPRPGTAARSCCPTRPARSSRATLPPGVSLRDLGEHRLKDLRAPERLAQLVIDGLPADFPPLRSLDARPNNLPTQLTTFVGRERELAEAGALLLGTRLLTLTGPGGTGKTRLSLQVAAEAAERFPDGVWFVALDAVRDPTLVVADDRPDARRRGQQPAGHRRRSPTSVAGKTVLLVLDNFEQVVAAGPDVAELLRRCPTVTCLVTTRIALHVSGEQEYPVPGPAGPARHAPPVRGRAAQPSRAALRDYDLDDAQPVRGGPPVHRPRERGPPRLRRDQRQCARPSPGSPRGCTACRWPSSSPPRGSSCSRPTRSWPASTTTWRR